MNHSELAVENFMRGYSCSQAVVVAFCDVTGMKPQYAARLSSSFGGGMGRMREVCGAVSGMLTVAGLLYGYSTPGDDAAKRAHYTLVQALAGQFREEHGSIICREIKGVDTGIVLRSCDGCVEDAAGIIEEYLAEIKED